MQLAGFAGLALFGVLRWNSLLTPAPLSRGLGMVALSLLIAGPLRTLASRHRGLGWLGASIGVLTMLVLAGVPAAWIVHARLAVSAREVGRGLGALPGTLVPYQGSEHAIRLVTELGAGGLLALAALPLALARGRARRFAALAAALPLVVLVVLASALLPGPVPYLHGLILFCGLILLIWGDQVPLTRVPSALVLIAAAAALALVLGPALDAHRPWVNVRTLSTRLVDGGLERFQWSQNYGAIDWPRRGQVMLQVRAARPDFWKAENLELFDGRTFTEGSPPAAQALPVPDPATRARFTQTIEVTFRGMRSTDVIAAGDAAAPQGLSAPVAPGLAPGTWVAARDLSPGDSYTVSTYSPQPTQAELARAKSDPGAQGLAGDRSMLLPATTPATGATAVLFSPFHGAGSSALQSSPYLRAYLLARGLARAAPTPYAFVQSVLAFLRHGFHYDEHPPAGGALPLLSFMFDSQRGYCQQFSGAMALLLRMGGLPARVAAGFTSGRPGGSATPGGAASPGGSSTWSVTDFDAHDWVEVWFTGFGWVRFDPTPSAGIGTIGTADPLHGRLRGTPHVGQVGHPQPAPVPAGGSRLARPHPGGLSPDPWIPATLSAALGLLGLLALLCKRGLGRPVSDRHSAGLLAELERALRRVGRPAESGMTLQGLERRLAHRPGAAAYVQAIRSARYAGAGTRPTAGQRRALRSALSEGLGPLGRLRALWALPPWPR